MLRQNYITPEQLYLLQMTYGNCIYHAGNNISPYKKWLIVFTMQVIIYTMQVVNYVKQSENLFGSNTGSWKMKFGKKVIWFISQTRITNCMMNLINERNHIFERTLPSFKPNVISKFLVTSTIFIFLLFRIFWQLCITVKYVAFATNLTLLTSMYHSEVRCICNKLNPFDIYVSQWSTLHLQQT